MKYKTTSNEVKDGYCVIISAGYCSLQNLLKDLSPTAYNRGVYGWNWDLYDVDGIAICTGYRSMPNKNAKEDYNLIREYDEKAANIQGWDDVAKAKRKELVKEFIQKARV